jgi:hypothetical protein
VWGGLAVVGGGGGGGFVGGVWGGFGGGLLGGLVGGVVGGVWGGVGGGNGRRVRSGVRSGVGGGRACGATCRRRGGILGGVRSGVRCGCGSLRALVGVASLVGDVCSGDHVASGALTSVLAAVELEALGFSAASLDQTSLPVFPFTVASRSGGGSGFPPTVVGASVAVVGRGLGGVSRGVSRGVGRQRRCGVSRGVGRTAERRAWVTFRDRNTENGKSEDKLEHMMSATKHRSRE